MELLFGLTEQRDSMKYFMYLIFAFIISGCTTTPPKILDSDIHAVKLSEDGQETSNVKIYLYDEGTAWASVRFEVSFISSPRITNYLYIKNNIIPELRSVFQRLGSNATPAKYEVDKGKITLFKDNTEQHVVVFTSYDILVFPVSEVPKIIAILDRLEQAAKPIK